MLLFETTCLTPPAMHAVQASDVAPVCTALDAAIAALYVLSAPSMPMEASAECGDQSLFPYACQI